MRRAILRFALTFSKEPKAARYVEKARAEDPERVEEAEALLKSEEDAAKAPTPKK